MKARIYLLFFILLGCFGNMLAAATLEDGTYTISCTKLNGYLGLGSYHGVNPYIYYVEGSLDMMEDAYWVITHTEQGYTFRNKATGQLLVFTTGRDDLYYKYMTLSAQPLGDQSEFWNIIQGSDGAYCVQSTISTDYYWNLRAGTNMLGTYKGSNGSSDNERYTFWKQDDTPTPGPVTPDIPSFPPALHVWLTNGKMEAYPLELVRDYTRADGKLVVETTYGASFTYVLTTVDSISERTPDFPVFQSYKFNNKFNDQLFTDADGQITGDTIFVTVAAIGKRLTPSFQIADENAAVYIGNQRQTSKESRLRFDKDIYYTVTREGYTILTPEEDNKYFQRPYGRIVRVSVNWLTDQARVPAIYINTADGQAVTSKDYFKDATIRIDGQGIFPSMEETYVQIKGRGNSSWGWAKKPYRIRFESSMKPLGMTKGKNWVLLANGNTGSLMANAIGMKAANLMKASAANHIVPVDLYLNGEYRGSYNFTEKVGFANNSVDLPDETAAAMLELDSYYDEPDGQKFRSQPYNLPINIKEPEFAEGTTTLTLTKIQHDFNNFVRTLNKSQDISQYVDIQQLSRFLMVNELICNFELYHPKSTFCYRESFDADSSKYIFGPVWDLDWGFGYEQNRNYFKANTTTNYWTYMPSFAAKQFIQDLRWNYEPMCQLYKQLWARFLEEDLQELIEYCQDYYDFACNSFIMNRDKWGDRTDYAQQARDAAGWIRTRANQIYQDILDDVRPPKPEPVEPVEFAANKLYTISCPRGDLILSYDYKGLEAGQNAWWTVYDYEKQFAIINIEGNNYLYSPYLKKFLRTGNVSNGEWVDELGSPIYFDNSHPEGDYLYMMSTLTTSGAIQWFNNNNKTIIINNYNTPDAGDRWKITEAGDFDPTEAILIAQSSMMAVTMNLMYDGKVIASETRKLPYGAEMPETPAQWSNAFVMVTPIGTHPYVVEGDTSVDYEAEWVGPFDFTTSESDAKWYNMTVRTEYMVGKSSTEPYYPATVYSVDTLAMLTYQWAFGGNPYKVKVYNRSTGLDEVLTLVGSKAVMRQGGYEWELIPHQDGFVLRVPETASACLNQFGGTNGYLGLWDDAKSLTDDGSTFRVMEAPDPDGMSLTPALPQGDGEVYDLAGRKVNAQPTMPEGARANGENKVSMYNVQNVKRGIYIVGGRKVVIQR